MIRTFLSFFHILVFAALGFSLCMPLVGLTLGTEISDARERVTALSTLRAKIEAHHAEQWARDLHEIGVDATHRRNSTASGMPAEHDRFIAPKPGAQNIQGKIAAMDRVPVLHSDGYLHLRVKTDTGLAHIITAEPAVIDILSDLSQGQEIWLRGEERLRLRHGYAMARRATRAVELTHFVIPPEAPLRLAQAQTSRNTR